jgi:ABC-2 type transport system ATP-binding protein
LLEFSGLYERMSAEDNLDLYGRIYKMPTAERRTRTRELLEPLDLWERRKDRVGTWSRGMKQKLAVARALFHRPPLVFLDEPTAGFDPVAAAAVRKDLASLVAHEGVTVFLNTHNLTEAEQLCAQVGVIRAGKLLAMGSPDSLRMGDKSPRVKITGRGFDERMVALLRQRPEVARVDHLPDRLEIELLDEKSRNGPLVSLIVQNGGEVEEISREGTSFEELFLTLMREEKP